MKLEKKLLAIFSLVLFFAVNNIDIAFSKPVKKSRPQVMQRTFAMIKPSGMNKANAIKGIISSYGLIILKSEKIKITDKQVDKLYSMHKDKPFYNDLKNSLAGKEVEIMVLYGDHAVERYRNAVKDIRSKYALNKTENAVHGSDSWELAHKEICLFFYCGAR